MDVQTVSWKKEIKLPNTNLTLKGFSVAARFTSFYIPEYKIMLDCGVPNNFSPDYIFITHSHFDHTGELPRTLYDMGTIKPVIVIPEIYVDRITNYIYSAVNMSKNKECQKIKSQFSVLPVKPNSEYSIFIKNASVTIESIKCFHAAMCCGYGFIENRKKLKSEYLTKTPGELKELKKNVEICENVSVPIFCYLGDSNYKVLESAYLDKYKTIIIECTFLDPDHIKYAKEDNHIHWSQLKPFIIKNNSKHFVLIHFSFRYTKEFINNFFENENIDNITIWT